MLFFVSGPLFESLPIAALCSVIVVALIPLYRQVKDPKNYWTLNKQDTIIWTVTFLAVVLLDMAIGLLIGVAFSVVTIVAKDLVVSYYNLVATQYHDIMLPENLYNIPNNNKHIHIFKYESNLYFLTVLDFKKKLFKTTINPQTPTHGKGFANTSLDESEDLNETKDQQYDSANSTLEDDKEIVPAGISTGSVAGIIVDCSCISYIDVMGLKMISQLSSDFRDNGIKFALANCCISLIVKLKIYNPDILIFPTIHDAFIAIEYEFEDEKAICIHL